MQYFLETSDTIVKDVGFSHYDCLHIGWLIVIALICALNCILYRKLPQKGRAIWKKTVAALLVADELFKMVILFIGGNYEWDYLPLHLCSINIFVIGFHAFKPSKTIGNFLYTICIPGALAALLFPTWTKLPLANAMHIHSFTVHMLLILYPIVLTVTGEIQPDIKLVPKCLGLLTLMAVPIYGLNILLDTNFMFLISAGKGTPLYWFKQNWGSHLWGFPVIIAGVLVVMHVPVALYQKWKKRV